MFNCWDSRTTVEKYFNIVMTKCGEEDWDKKEQFCYEISFQQIIFANSHALVAGTSPGDWCPLGMRGIYRLHQQQRYLVSGWPGVVMFMFTCYPLVAITNIYTCVEALVYTHDVSYVGSSVRVSDFK